MAHKKTLHPIKGTGETMEARMQRTNLSRPELAQHDERFDKKTWQTKGKPKSSWYPETPDREIYGRKS